MRSLGRVGTRSVRRVRRAEDDVRPTAESVSVSVFSRKSRCFRVPLGIPQRAPGRTLRCSGLVAMDLLSHRGPDEEADDARPGMTPGTRAAVDDLAFTLERIALKTPGPDRLASAATPPRRSPRLAPPSDDAPALPPTAFSPLSSPRRPRLPSPPPRTRPARAPPRKLAPSSSCDTSARTSLPPPPPRRIRARTPRGTPASGRGALLFPRRRRRLERPRPRRRDATPGLNLRRPRSTPAIAWRRSRRTAHTRVPRVNPVRVATCAPRRRRRSQRSETRGEKNCER